MFFNFIPVCAEPNDILEQKESIENEPYKTLEEKKKELKEALLTMDSGDENAKSVLEFFQTDKFIETTNENYEKIESVAKKLGLVK